MFCLGVHSASTAELGQFLHLLILYHLAVQKLVCDELWKRMEHFSSSCHAPSKEFLLIIIELYADVCNTNGLWNGAVNIFVRGFRK